MVFTPTYPQLLPLQTPSVEFNYISEFALRRLSLLSMINVQKISHYAAHYAVMQAGDLLNNTKQVRHMTRCMSTFLLQDITDNNREKL